MASSYSNPLRLEEIGVGEASGTWGTKTNTTLSNIATAFAAKVKNLGSDADATLTMPDGSADDLRALHLKITSVALTATRTITIAPNTVSKIWIVENATTGNQAITFSQGSGSNVSLANGETKILYTDGAGSGAAVVDALTDLNISGTTVLANATVSTAATVGGVTNGVSITQGAIALKNGGTQSKIDFYCESSNAHYTRLQSAPHSAYSGNITLTLPASDGNADQVLSTDGNGVMSWATGRLAGLDTIYVPAAAMYPNTTNGSSDLEQVELTNGPELKCLDFAAAADDFAQFTVIFPKSWNEGTVTFQPFWTVTGTNAGTVAWGLSAVSFADTLNINQAFGTQIVTTAKAFSGTSNDMTVSAVSGAVTITNAAVDTQTYFQVSRDVSADSQTGDARLLGIKLFFTTDAANDG